VHRVCVFCGSEKGNRAEYSVLSRRLGSALVDQGLGLVYGGANVGLMGTLADEVLRRDGYVIGVIPKALVAKEIAHPKLTDLRVVGSMHERKATMAELSDAFIAMPGGFGTIEEFVEVLTWAQLGLHRKPCALLNVSGFFDPFLRFIDHMVKEGFITKDSSHLVLSDSDPTRLLNRIKEWQPPQTQKWIGRVDV
jgi:uncharacterized protein (TIGR00730 family)